MTSLRLPSTNSPSLLVPGVVLGLVVGVTGCKTQTVDAPASDPSISSPDHPPSSGKRPAELADALPRLGPDVSWNDPEDDPELTDDYYSGNSESDGAAQGEALPRPKLSGLPGARSFSIGPPNGGWLMRGQALPLRGRYHRVLPGTARRGWFYGTDNLVKLLVEAATRVGEAHPPAVLRVGNLSRRQGGKIAPSVSHQSGRDADIGLYCTDLDDNPVDPAGFPKFDGSRGPLVDRTGRYLFDVKRNWTFVAALLESKRVRIQWVFLDTPLKQALLDYAIRSGANAQTIDKVEKLTVRPRNSSPHANHYHIRIFCDEGDLEYGCRDYGPEWSWVKEQRAARRRYLEDRVDRILKGEEKLSLEVGKGKDKAQAKGKGLDAAQPPNGPGIDDLPDPPTGVPLKL